MAESKIFRSLRWLHKYLTLFTLIYCLWMGLSGIFLNHPQLIKKFSLENRIMPANYQYLKWNRMSWRDATFSRSQPNILYVGGKEGVWKSTNQGKNFTPLKNGFPTSAYEKDTFCILLAGHDDKETLLAGTRSGLFYQQESHWQPILHPVLSTQPVLDLIQVKQQILAFTDSAAFTANIDTFPPKFTELSLPRAQQTTTMPLFRWLRKIHDGSIFGLKGRLFVDLIGLTLVFLSLSGLIIWYVKFIRKRGRKTILAGGIFALNYHWHLKLGSISALFITITALSGAFAHPPLLLTIARLKTPASLQPQKNSDNPWREQIQRATYLKSRQRLIIATKQGLFSGPIDGSREFLRLPDTLPIHGMGALVFESLDDSRLVIGSFSGLYLWDTADRIVMELKAKAKPGTPDWGRPIMAAGILIENGEPIQAIDYESGLKPLKLRPQTTPAMPGILRTQSRISLWHALFELHNGRIFEEYIGPFYWLITPAGGIIFCLILISGSLLWLRRKIHRGRITDS
jgi:hypothetical protein